MEEDMSMEELGMKGSKIEKKAMMAKRKKEKELRELRGMLKIDRYPDMDDELDLDEFEDVLSGMIKALKKPVVKAMFGAKSYKKVVNSLIDAAMAVEATVEANDKMEETYKKL